MKRVRDILLQLGIIVVITMALLEALVYLSFRFPGVSPVPLPVTRYLYERFDRRVIQVMPECARYDEVVTYTLRPGHCTFANREFSNTFSINAIGLRDDDASTQAPEIIVLGDSVAMGWGVEQDEAFPQTLERLTGRRTLNAGVSSYGTARELLLLQRLDRRALRHLVIQHSLNDLQENEAFLQPGFRTLTFEAYAETVERQEADLAYFPGKYAVHLLIHLRTLATAAPVPSDPPWEVRQARSFIGVLERSPVDLTELDLTVVVFDRAVAREIETIKSDAAGEHIRRLVVVDVSDLATVDEMHYRLDDHPTARGHAAIAERLAGQIVSPR